MWCGGGPDFWCHCGQCGARRSLRLQWLSWCWGMPQTQAHYNQYNARVSWRSSLPHSPEARHLDRSGSLVCRY